MSSLRAWRKRGSGRKPGSSSQEWSAARPNQSTGEVGNGAVWFPQAHGLAILALACCFFMASARSFASPCAPRGRCSTNIKTTEPLRSRASLFGDGCASKPRIKPNSQNNYLFPLVCLRHDQYSSVRAAAVAASRPKSKTIQTKHPESSAHFPLPSRTCKRDPNPA